MLLLLIPLGATAGCYPFNARIAATVMLLLLLPLKLLLVPLPRLLLPLLLASATTTTTTTATVSVTAVPIAAAVSITVAGTVSGQQELGGGVSLYGGRASVLAIAVASTDVIFVGGCFDSVGGSAKPLNAGSLARLC